MSGRAPYIETTDNPSLPYALYPNKYSKVLISEEAFNRLYNSMERLRKSKKSQQRTVRPTYEGAKDTPIEDHNCWYCGEFCEKAKAKSFMRDKHGQLHWARICPKCYRRQDNEQN